MLKLLGILALVPVFVELSLARTGGFLLVVNGERDVKSWCGLPTRRHYTIHGGDLGVNSLGSYIFLFRWMTLRSWKVGYSKQASTCTQKQGVDWSGWLEPQRSVVIVKVGVHARNHPTGPCDSDLGCRYTICIVFWNDWSPVSQPCTSTMGVCLQAKSSACLLLGKHQPYLSLDQKTL